MRNQIQPSTCGPLHWVPEAKSSYRRIADAGTKANSFTRETGEAEYSPSPCRPSAVDCVHAGAQLRDRIPGVHGREPVSSKENRNLAAVKRVMHDEPRQDRLPSVPLDLAGPLTSERLAEHLRRPARQA